MLLDEYTLIKPFKNGSNGEVYIGYKNGSRTNGHRRKFRL